MAHPRLLLLLCPLALMTTGCMNRDNELADTPMEAASIPAHYRPFLQGSIDDDDIKAALDALPYRSISLRRTSCFGPCPVYTFTLRSDLTAKLVAKENLEPQGISVGEVDIFDFGRLCYLVDTIRFTSFEPKYSANWTDSSTAIVTIIRADGTQITVSDYGGVGPITLWGLTEVIDSLRSRIEWTPAANESPQ